MARLALCVLALAVASGFADPIKNITPKAVDKAFADKQLELMLLFFHINEPNHIKSCHSIAETWNITENIEHYSNVTAVKELVKTDWILPRGVPFSILEHTHRHQAITLFNVLFSAKDYKTFYNTAVYLRDHWNEELFVYVLGAVILHRPDTQGVTIPQIYEILPSYFNNGEVMTTAQRLNTHGDMWIKHYPSTYKWDENFVIRWNATTWPYFVPTTPVSYFTHDYALNTWYYNWHLAYPSWLGGESVPLVKDKRGASWWFLHKQIVARYYLERLSNGLGEIPEVGHTVFKEGYTPGLLYPSGIAFPVRPNYFHLDQPEFVDDIEDITVWERRIRDAIDSGYFINKLGEEVSIRSPEAIDILGNLIEANVDSPNSQYYKDFISVWKRLLGNSVTHETHTYYHDFTPLVVPSVLEHYQTALRDPAFYVIWKRVLKLFSLWQHHLPHYKSEELAVPSVTIQKVEVDKLMSYFEQTYLNVSSYLPMNEHESERVHDDVSVLVQHPRLNHKVFKIKVNVKSEVAKTVVVKFFLGPKFDSKGVQIPLHKNTENFFLFDEFTYDLPEGECVITRSSNEYNPFVSKDWSTYDVFQKALNAHNGKGQFVIDQYLQLDKFPQRLLLPKGRVGGMPFVLFVYVSDYHAPKVPYGTGYDHTASLGLGSGATYHTDQPWGFPLDRPLYQWQVENLHNVWFQDVLIHHKHTPEIEVPHTE